jgi:hypothetical protein
MSRPAQLSVDLTVVACGVFHMLVSIMSSDNGVMFTYDSEDWLKAVPAIIEMVNAGYFGGDPEVLEGDFWQMAAGDETETPKLFDRTPEAFAVVHGVLNDIFDRPLDKPTSPTQQEPVSGEAVAEVVASRDGGGYSHSYNLKWNHGLDPLPIGTKLYNHPQPDAARDVDARKAFALDALIAAGYVDQLKADEAMDLWPEYADGDAMAAGREEVR